VTLIDFKDVVWTKPGQTVMNAVDGGFNVVLLGFYTFAHGPVDFGLTWSGLSKADQAEAMKHAHDKSAAVLLSAGGPSDSPYLNLSGTEYGSKAGQFAKDNQLDGVNFDLQYITPGFASSLVQWIIDASVAARKVLGNDAIVSHSPLAPYFGEIGKATNPFTGTSGGYTAVEKAVGGVVDFYNVVFFNQGDKCYVSYETMFTGSNTGNVCPMYPGTSVKEIASYGVDENKLVLGKPVTTGDAASGFNTASDLNKFVNQAGKELKWNAGVYAFQWTNVDAPKFLSTIYATATL